MLDRCSTAPILNHKSPKLGAIRDSSTPYPGQRSRVALVICPQGCEVLLGFLLRRCRHVDDGQLQSVEQFYQEQAGNAAVEIREWVDVQQTPFGESQHIDQVAAFVREICEPRIKVGGVVEHQDRDPLVRRCLVRANLNVSQAPAAGYLRGEIGANPPVKFERQVGDGNFGESPLQDLQFGVLHALGE